MLVTLQPLKNIHWYSDSPLIISVVTKYGTFHEKYIGSNGDNGDTEIGVREILCEGWDVRQRDT